MNWKNKKVLLIPLFASILILSLLQNLRFLPQIRSVKASPAYEDFTTYTVVEPDDRIQVTTNHIDLLAYRNEDAYVYKDKGVDHFTDFEHHVDAESDFAQASGMGALWSCQNYIDDFRGGYEGGEAGIAVAFINASGTFYALMVEITGGAGGYYPSGNSDALSADTTYYFLVKKTGTTLVCGVYSTANLRNAGDGTDGDKGNLALTLHSDWNLRYIYGCSSWNDGSGSQYLNLDVDNLDLQEEPPPENSVTLNLPTNDSTETSYTVDFNFSTTIYDGTIHNASLWTNETSWSLKHSNSSTVENATAHVIQETFGSEGTYIWNIQVYNSTTESVWASSNYTLTVDIPPRYQNVDSNATSIAEGGTILLYGQGYDGIGLDWAVLSTNETGSWKNYTDTGVWTKQGIVLIPDQAWDGSVSIEPSVLYEDDKFKMWYRGSSGSSSRIGYAESEDGVNWNKFTGNPVVDYPALAYPSVIKNGTDYLLYACNISAPSNEYVLFVGSNETNFTPHAENPVLSLGAGGQWDDLYLGNPFVWKEESDWYMLYEARGNGEWKLGLATSADGVDWTKSGSNPVLDSTSGGAGGPQVEKVGSMYYVWYQAGGLPTDIYRANSTDLTTWIEYDYNPVFPRTEDYEGVGNPEGQVADPTIVEAEGTTWMWYDAIVDQTPPPDHRIALAKTSLTISQIVTTSENSASNPYYFYDSPMDMGDVADTWTWSNFTWTNSSISGGTTIQWRIYYNDTYGNVNGTGIHTFSIGDGINENSVTLNSPSNGATKTSYTVNFKFTPIFYQPIQNACLWTNEGGWSNKQWNSTTIQNNTQNTISETFSLEGTYIWNIQVFNSTYGLFAPANFTVTVDIPSPPPIPPPTPPPSQSQLVAQGTNFQVYFMANSKLAFQHIQIPYTAEPMTITVTVDSGTMNGTAASVTMWYTSGIFRFTSQDTGVLSISTVSEKTVAVKVNGGSYGSPFNISPSNQYTIEWSVAGWDPIMAIMGLCGIGLLIITPTLSVWQIKVKKNYYWIFYSIVLFIIAYAFITMWIA